MNLYQAGAMSKSSAYHMVATMGMVLGLVGVLRLDRHTVELQEQPP